MDNLALIESFADFKEEKNIDRSTLIVILEECIRVVLRKRYGSADNFDIIVNPDKGDLEIWRNRTVVEDGGVQRDNEQIELLAAKKIESDFEIGEEVSEKVELEDLGRRAILSLKQNLLSKSKEYYNTVIYKKFKDCIREIIVGEIHYMRYNKNLIIRDDNHNEMILPREEQIPNDFSRKGDSLRAIIKEVRLDGTKPIVILSRRDPEFLKKLFEQEIPEIIDGLIIVKNVVRIPGEKAKVAVESYDDRIDSVGACIGMKGTRIHSIVKELRNENIDVINYTTNNQLYITRAISPAKISTIKIDQENKIASVLVKPDQVSKAIGRNGQNIQLASQLTGYKINIFRDSPYEDDVEITEFSDEIEPWIIEQFRNVDLDTARTILDCDLEDLVRRTDLEEDTILDVCRILKEEFNEIK